MSTSPPIACGINQRSCCVPQCRNAAYKNKSLKFHKFPRVVPNWPKEKNERALKRRNDWIRILKMGKKVSDTMCVCSEHFVEFDYFRTTPGTGCKVARLKETAVPSQKLPVFLSASKKERDREERRAALKRRRKYLDQMIKSVEVTADEVGHDETCETAQSSTEKVCELLPKESDIEVEMSAVDPKTGETLTDRLCKNHLEKNVVPSLNNCSQKTFKSMPNRELPEQKRKRLEIGQLSQALHTSLKNFPGINSSVKDTCETSFSSNASFSRQTENDAEAENKRGFKKRRKFDEEEISKSTDTSFSEPSSTQQSCNQNFIADDNNSNSTVSFPQVQVKEEKEWVEEYSFAGDSSSNSDKTNKKESFDSTFYKKPLKIEKREESFMKLVACEMSDLRVNPELYLKTQQSILKLLVEAHFELMSSSNGA